MKDAGLQPAAAPAALLGAALLLAACTNMPLGERDRPPAAPRSTAQVPDATPRAEPRSRYGNGPVYEVFGQRYEVLPSSTGYRERGVASWYGQKFHGRPTASRERYDMYAMTAAHKSLPLPTYVEVRNLRNGKRVIVRVNDRGPFVDNRVIDLSYAAAMKLDMVRDGTSLVEVTAIDVDAPAHAGRAPEPDRLSASEPAQPAARRDLPRVFVQVGAFGDRGNASRRHRLLEANGIAPAFVHEDRRAAGALYRVRVGPIDGVAQYDALVAQLQAIGIRDTHLVTD